MAIHDRPTSDPLLHREDLPTAAIAVGPSGLGSGLDTGSGDGTGHSATGTGFGDAPPQKPPPSQIGPYRIVRQVGEGGMGVVYLATHVEADPPRPVALKLLRRGMSVDEVLTRFRRERSVLAQLDHPNIARLLDAGESEDAEPYFVMEFVDGQSMDEYCDSRKLSVAERIDMVRAVCAAVHHAHQHLVVHRDIKPRNIMVTADGVPKLLDFGIAKIINPGEASGPDLPTAPEVRAMTPEYASPEQIRGLPVSTATDIYSLGVVLYEILSGHRPFVLRNRSFHEVERTVCEIDPERPSEAIARVALAFLAEDENPGSDAIPKPSAARSPTKTPEQVAALRGGETPARLERMLRGDLDNIALMALRKEPQRRYPSAEALAEDLRRHQDGHPVVAAPDTLRYRARKFLARNRVAVGAAVVVAVVLVVASAAFAWQATVANRERATAVEQRDRADRRFSELRTLAKTVLFDVYDSINRLEGSTEARQLVVREGLTYLDRLAQEAGGDPTLMEEVAAGYQRLGDVQGGMRGNNLGDSQGAEKSYQHAKALREEVLAMRRDDAAAQASLATSIVALADVMRRQGNTAAARELYHDAAVLQEAVVSANPRDTAGRMALAAALQSEGDILFQDDDLPAAARIYDRSVEIRRGLIAERPEELDLRRSLATSLLRLGRIAERRGDMPSALKHYRDNYDVRRELAAARESDGRLQRDMLGASRVYGDCLRMTGDLDGALDQHTSVLKLAKRLAEADPKNARGRLDLALAHESLGRTLRERGDDPGAAAELEQACALAVELRRADPADRFAGQMAASAHEQLAALRSTDRPDEALIHQREALALWQSLAEPVAEGDEESGGGTSRRERADTARALVVLGIMLLERREFVEARSTLTAALGEYRTMETGGVLDDALASDRDRAVAALGSLPPGSGGE